MDAKVADWQRTRAREPVGTGTAGAVRGRDALAPPVKAFFQAGPCEPGKKVYGISARE